MAEQNASSSQPQMRRIAQKGELPTEKQELIRYLTERIQQAEEALQDTQAVLERQRLKRQRIAESLADRSKQLNKLLELDKKSLPEKIKERLEEILTEAINSKIDVETQLENSNKTNYEYKQILAELKDLEAQEAMEQQIIGERENNTLSQLKTVQNGIKVTEDQIKELEEAIAKKKRRNQQITNAYLQMRVAVDRMGEVKNSLNRFFGNEDLFDEHQQLKEQTVYKPIRSPLPEEKKEVPALDKPPKLKPIEKKPQRNLQTNNQDDFWNAQVADRKPNPKQKLPSFKK